MSDSANPQAQRSLSGLESRQTMYQTMLPVKSANGRCSGWLPENSPMPPAAQAEQWCASANPGFFKEAGRRIGRLARCNSIEQVAAQRRELRNGCHARLPAAAQPCRQAKASHSPSQTTAASISAVIDGFIFTPCCG